MSARAIFVTVLMFSCLVATSGCHRNRAKTSPNLPVIATLPEPAPIPELETSAPASEPDAIEPDPLSGELGEINEYLRRQGLLGDVYFDYDQSSLSSEAREQLARSARFLHERPQFTLVLEGHCDERGTDEYNLALGERRAQTTKDYLMALGVPVSLVSTISYGEERPACRESEESCWWQNRRAHALVTGRNDH